MFIASNIMASSSNGEGTCTSTTLCSQQDSASVQQEKLTVCKHHVACVVLRLVQWLGHYTSCNCCFMLLRLVNHCVWLAYTPTLYATSIILCQNYATSIIHVLCQNYAGIIRQGLLSMYSSLRQRAQKMPILKRGSHRGGRPGIHCIPPKTSFPSQEFSQPNSNA